LGEVVETMIGQRVPAPERKGFPQVVRGRRRLVLTERDSRAVEKLLEAGGGDRTRGGLQGGARRPLAQPRSLPQLTAQARDLLLQGLNRAPRNRVAPQRLEQVVARDDLGRTQRQEREEPALLDAFELDALTRLLDLHRAEQPDLDHRAHGSPLRPTSPAW